MALPTVARFSVHNAPPITLALPFAKLARRALLSVYGGPERRPCPLLAGKDDAGRPMTNHLHPFYLPSDDDRDGIIDHLTIVCRSGFTDEVQLAFYRLARINDSTLCPPVRLGRPSIGAVNEFRKALLFRSSVAWRSLTPFFLPRHPYRRYSRLQGARLRLGETPVEQFRRELAYHGLPASADAHLIGAAWLHDGGTINWRDFRCTDRDGSRPASQRPYGLSVTFPDHVLGPIALGALCHFGLGLFVPVSSPDTEAS